MKSVTLIASATLLSVLFIYLQWPRSEPDLPSSTKEVLNEPWTQAASNSAINEVLPIAGFTNPSEKGEASVSSSIWIDPSKDNFIYGKKGTGVFFPANSFLDADGKIVTKQVEIQLNEYYEIPEMLQANLTTTSDGRLIETAGMVNIRAFSSKEELRLNDSVNYGVYFPKNGSKKTGFQLFYGDILTTGDINWRLAEAENRGLVNDQGESEWNEKKQNALFGEEIIESAQTTSSPAFSSLLNDEDNCFLQICESYLRRGTRVSEMDYFNWQLTNGQTLNQWFVANFNPDLEMLDRFCILGLRSEITFKVDRDGAFQSYYISQASEPIYDRLIADFLSTMPPLDLSLLMPEYNVDHACILTFGGKESDSQQQFAAAIRRKYSDNPEAKVSGIDAATLDYFVFASSELGWINCDRFLDDEDVLVDYSIQNKSDHNGSVNLIFDDINSVLKGVSNGDVITFFGIPANKNVRLVGLDHQQSEPVMCVKSANTSDKTTTLNSYRPFSWQELEQEFRARKN